MRKSVPDDRYPRARKSLGQHFLVDRRAITAIVSAIPEGSSVLEIGPGRGALTRPLLRRAGRLVVIEKDDRLAAEWQRVAEEWAGLRVIHGDVMEELEATLCRHRPDWIVGNLPYNISGPLTARLVARTLPGGMVLMYQKEVADRIGAEPGCGRGCGAIGVISRYCWRITRLLRLPPGAFAPPPRVHSAVLRFTPNGRSFDAEAFAALQRCVRTGFAHRRKTIANNLRGRIEPEMLRGCGIDPALRPEQLTQAQWLRLAAALT
ncbi:MAG: ribosomal RNA small subunit methyltransferase A [Zetaproteobacteria bacterium]|nr:MAG: ribosomal RNA small subunit methyltransferase A [Zetaproteobacteria bacterium]